MRGLICQGARMEEGDTGRYQINPDFSDCIAILYCPGFTPNSLAGDKFFQLEFWRYGNERR
jgi:hypothetical protein